MSTEATGIYDQWLESHGDTWLISNAGFDLSEALAIELIDWVLAAERSRTAQGHRHVTITDREDLAALGYELHQDGGYHRRSQLP